MVRKSAALAFILFLLVACNFPLVRGLATTPTLSPTSTPVIADTETPTQAPTETPLVPTEAPAIATATAIPVSGHIVYSCFIDDNDDICIMNADGSDQRQLTHNPATDFYPSLSPDGKTILFSSNRNGHFEIYSMNVDGSNQTRLTNNIGNLYAPAFSPDGSQIVFTNEGDHYQHIWSMNRDGKNPHPLTEGDNNNIDPTWAPNGQAIAFVSDRNGFNQLFIMSADGSNPFAVTTDAPYPSGRSSWSPDMSTLAFYSGTAAKLDRNIYLVSPSGHNLRQITDSGDNLAPSFSPDGNWIVFTSYRDAINQVYIMLTDGSNAQRLTFTSYSCWQPRWGP
ncbi:MAG: DPP IV N-terminal domain-containing protein [Anaerolineaceae bacterium]|jgi:Tol biopolymer transport system component